MSLSHSFSGAEIHVTRYHFEKCGPFCRSLLVQVVLFREIPRSMRRYLHAHRVHGPAEGANAEACLMMLSSWYD